MSWWQKESLLPFKPCSSFIISGATRSGKTYWTKKMLENARGMFVEKPPKYILYFYGVYQPLFDEMKKTVKNIHFFEGIPTDKILSKYKSDHTIVILDDLMNDVLKDVSIEKMFTQGCHHRGLSVIFITQNIFAQGKCSRTISLNTTYLILFRNIRDVNQVNYLATQLGNKKSFMDAYNDALSENYGYLIVDMSPATSNTLRLRTRVFPGEFPIVYPH